MMNWNCADIHYKKTYDEDNNRDHYNFVVKCKESGLKKRFITYLDHDSEQLEGVSADLAFDKLRNEIESWLLEKKSVEYVPKPKLDEIVDELME